MFSSPVPQEHDAPGSDGLARRRVVAPNRTAIPVRGRRGKLRGWRGIRVVFSPEPAGTAEGGKAGGGAQAGADEGEDCSGLLEVGVEGGEVGEVEGGGG